MENFNDFSLDKRINFMAEVAKLDKEMIYLMYKIAEQAIDTNNDYPNLYEDEIILDVLFKNLVLESEHFKNLNEYYKVCKEMKIKGENKVRYIAEKFGGIKEFEKIINKLDI